MPLDPRGTTYFKQARFTTRLPNGYWYSPAHYWVREAGSGVLQVGMTKFATRMLGDFVEYHLEPPIGERVEVGQAIGSLEGFKAVAEIYCAVAGEFVGGNSQIAQQPELIDNDPYDQGWLYAVRGPLPNDLLDVAAYTGVLNATIERMLAESKTAEEKTC